MINQAICIIRSSISCVLLSAIIAGCGPGKTQFIVCPYSLSAELLKKKQVSERRELLYSIDNLSYLIAKRDRKENIIPVQHYRPKHTFSNQLMPINVSWSTPLHISTVAIIDKSENNIGVAIKEMNSGTWHIYWLSKDEYEDAVSREVIVLPPLKKMPIVSKLGE